MLALRDDPWLGDDLRERYNLRPLKGCRRIRFDREGWQGRPRYRLVYRNEPETARQVSCGCGRSARARS